MNNPFPFLRKKDQFFLALDIGTEAIKALIFRRNFNASDSRNKIIISGSSLQQLGETDVFNRSVFQKRPASEIFSEAIREACQNCAPQGLVKRRIAPVLVGLSADILKNRIICQSFERVKSKDKIKEREAVEIIRMISETAKKEVSKEFGRELGILPKDFNFINLEILEMRIDGYEVSALSGFSGKKLEFKILTTFIFKYYLEKIEEIIKELKLRDFRIISGIQNLPLALNDKKITGFFLDIGGEISQIILIKDGRLQGVGDFKSGGKIFSQRLSQVLGIRENEAEELKIKYSRNLLSEETRKKIRDFFYQDAKLWLGQLKNEMKKMPTQYLPFSAISLFGGGSQLPEIEDILEEENWEDPPILPSPGVKYILPKDFINIEDKTGRVNNPQYTPSLLICYAP